MAFTARTTVTFGEAWTVVASTVRVTQVQFEVIFRAIPPTPKRQAVFNFSPINS